MGSASHVRRRPVEAGHLPYAEALVRDPSADERVRHSDGAIVVGSQEREDDDDLHARPEPGRPGCTKPARPARLTQRPGILSARPRMPRSIEASPFLQERSSLPAVAARHPYGNDQELIRFRRPGFFPPGAGSGASASRLTPSSTGRKLAKSKFS